MIATLERIYNVLASGATSSVGFLSQIFAKFCLIGYGSMFLRVFIKSSNTLGPDTKSKNPKETHCNQTF